jgi:tellurite resistance protein TehA-like permease
MAKTAGRLSAGVRELDPGYFALVMATGIVSVALGGAGAAALSAVMLGVTVASYLVLVAASGWRLRSYRPDLLADAAEPATAFAFFSFVAGSDVLGVRLAADDHHLLTAALLVVAAAAWLLLSYGLPLALVTRTTPGAALARVNGTWFLWTVGTQSLAVAVTTFPPWAARRLAPVAVGLWAVGVVLYLLTAGLVLAGLLQFPVGPADLTPAYWVFMGATAISVLAGAGVLGLPPGPLVAAVHPVVAGLSVMLWAFGTWLIPLLICLGVWRHLVRRVPLRYEPALWSMVFPLGMYCTASRALGAALNVPWLVTTGKAGSWLAFAVWALVFAAMSRRLARRSGRVPASAADGGNAA